MKEGKAVILVGGEGTRLRPLTLNRPKPMVPVVNRPFLEYMVEYLKGHGIPDIVLALGYLPNRIQQHFGHGEDFGIRMVYVVEDTPLGTAGAVKNVERHLGDTFVVLNGDIITDLDLTAMLAFHREKGAKVTIALTPVEDPSSFGVVETDARGRVRRFIEKPPPGEATSNMINAGCYILDPQVLGYVPPGDHYMFERGLFPLLLELSIPVYGYPFEGYWRDIGTPENYLDLHCDILKGRVSPNLPGRSLTEDLWIGGDCRIHPTAQIKGPVVLAKECTIEPRSRIIGPVVVGQGCTIAEGAVVEETVLWHRVQIGAQVTVKRCVVGENSVIEDKTRVPEGLILGDNEVLGGPG